MAIWVSASSVQTDVKKPPKHVQSAERKSLKFAVSMNRKDKNMIQRACVECDDKLIVKNVRSIKLALTNTQTEY